MSEDASFTQVDPRVLRELAEDTIGAIRQADGPEGRVQAFRTMAPEWRRAIGLAGVPKRDAVDRLEEILLVHIPEFGDDERTAEVARYFEVKQSSGDFVFVPTAAEREVAWTGAIPASISEWLDRDLPDPDYICGRWLTTTSRVLFVADTGIGKTMFVVALGMHIAEGLPFLHWSPPRRARVLFIDGEMSRRLLRKRIADAARRLGMQPTTFFAISHEDVPGFAPLNTPEGQRQIEDLIEKRFAGAIDLVIFDNIMSLILGDQKEEDGWSAVMPWVLSLTARGIGQLWVHHTGHDSGRSYGTKTREWQMDTVLVCQAEARADTDVSFRIEFRKGRERTPETRADFQDAAVALVADEWTSDAVVADRRKSIPPLTEKFLAALTNVLTTDQAAIVEGRRAAHRDQWKAECLLLGLLDPEKDHSARTLLSKARRDLVAANRIACSGEFSWLL